MSLGRGVSWAVERLHHRYASFVQRGEDSGGYPTQIDVYKGRELLATQV